LQAFEGTLRVTLFRVTCSAQRLFEMGIERSVDRARIVTRFTVEQTFRDKCLDFGHVQLNHQTAKALPPALPVKAHAFGGRAWLGSEIIHGFMPIQG
jgi:hypothetical protein